MTPTHSPFSVAALYHFTPLEELEGLKAELAAFACARGIKGTLLLAPEGINGTIAGEEGAIDALLVHLSALVPALADMDVKRSTARHEPFKRMKVRLKREIVTMGVEGIDPNRLVGTYVEPRDWNALIADPETLVIDTRNGYEVSLGTFRNALDPETESFRDFPRWAEAHRAEMEGRPVAMFCTGGIRCEKASAYLRGIGVEEVYHLKGGILRYLEEVPAQESLWQGECFVFDERVGIGHGLVEGEARLCHACGRPLTAESRRSAHYREGISCAACIGEYSDADRLRFAERQKQLQKQTRPAARR
ncbi:MAG: rhodanese-related sulfurtransferase [Methylobacterium mesophilicum]|nr:rhodanese-related sulfurtransferase [Methylobacterium mesophilicum]